MKFNKNPFDQEDKNKYWYYENNFESPGLAQNYKDNPNKNVGENSRFAGIRK